MQHEAMFALRPNPEPFPEVPVHPTVLTHSGNVFHYITPMHSLLEVEDVAHALANQCRFGGHTKAFYSYAQHAVMVSRLVPAEDALHALFADAAKALIGNVQTACKPLLPDYQRLEERILRAVYAHLHLEWPTPPSVHVAALVMRATERRDLLPPNGKPWPELIGVQPLPDRIVPELPQQAKDLFLHRYESLLPHRSPKLALVE